MRDPATELPRPEDDGAADHLRGTRLPPIGLPATDGRHVQLDALKPRSVIFVYPAIGGPGEGLLEEWTAVPGARGCTPEACGFRDELAEFRALGVDVLGLSNADHATQLRHVSELGLTYPLLSDESMQLAATLRLPSFEFHGERFYKRLTLVVGHATIESALYPVFPPQDAAAQALRRLRGAR